MVKPVLLVGKTPRGERWKAYVRGGPAGQMVGHWKGPHHRLVTVPNQPGKGFKTPEAAEKHGREFFLDHQEELDKWAHHAGDGMFLTQQRSAQGEFKVITLSPARSLAERMGYLQQPAREFELVVFLVERGEVAGKWHVPLASRFTAREVLLTTFDGAWDTAEALRDVPEVDETDLDTEDEPF